MSSDVSTMVDRQLSSLHRNNRKHAENVKTNCVRILENIQRFIATTETLFQEKDNLKMLGNLCGFCTYPYPPFSHLAEVLKIATCILMVESQSLRKQSRSGEKIIVEIDNRPSKA